MSLPFRPAVFIRQAPGRRFGVCNLTMDRGYVEIGRPGLVGNVDLLGSVPNHRIADHLTQSRARR